MSAGLHTCTSVPAGSWSSDVERRVGVYHQTMSAHCSPVAALCLLREILNTNSQLQLLTWSFGKYSPQLLYFFHFNPDAEFSDYVYHLYFCRMSNVLFSWWMDLQTKDPFFKRVYISSNSMAAVFFYVKATKHPTTSMEGKKKGSMRWRWNHLQEVAIGTEKSMFRRQQEQERLPFFLWYCWSLFFFLW